MDTIEPINVLVTLHHGYGIGDAVQMSAVLRHVRKYRPHWKIDFQAEMGKECVGNGIAHHTFYFGQPYPSAHYDADVMIILYDTWANWGDRPNTRVSSCLHERFGIAWDAECGRYEINVSEQALDTARAIVPSSSVALHYQGDSAPEKKDLTHAQAEEICGLIRSVDKLPFIIDWRGKSPLTCRRVVGKIGKDIDLNCAVIKCCDAFIGIDSGPSKCASATDTPSLVIWTGHHPAVMHDPAPNTTHLVPEGYHGLFPVCNDPGVIQWFEAHYNVMHYTKNNLLEQVEKWLKEELKRET